MYWLLVSALYNERQMGFATLETVNSFPEVGIVLTLHVWVDHLSCKCQRRTVGISSVLTIPKNPQILIEGGRFTILAKPLAATAE